jgi:hypothetical protein
MNAACFKRYDINDPRPGWMPSIKCVPQLTSLAVSRFTVLHKHFLVFRNKAQ